MWLELGQFGKLINRTKLCSKTRICIIRRQLQLRQVTYVYAKNQEICSSNSHPKFILNK